MPTQPDSYVHDLRALSGAVASFEKLVDALRRDIDSGERTIRLIAAAQAASSGA